MKLYAMHLCLAVLALSISRISSAVDYKAPSAGDRTAADSPTNNRVGQLIDLASGMQKILPSGEAKCVADRVFNLVNMSAYSKRNVEAIGDSNAGMVANIRAKIESDPCFEKRLRTFWLAHDGTLASVSNPLSEAAGSDFEPTGSDRPNITERAGAGRYGDRQPGWIWKDALAASGGNANRAMELIGACLNDDYPPEFQASVSGSEKDELVKKFSTEAKSRLTELRESERGMESSSVQFAILNVAVEENNFLLSALQSSQDRKDKSYKFTWSCPSKFSDAFAQQSVDQSFDVPEALKKEIISSQRPGGDTTTLASKAYHFVGGAMVGCELAKCGVSADLAALAGKSIAMVYRGLRLCPKIKQLLADRDQFSKKTGLAPDDPAFNSRYVSQLFKQSGISNTNKDSDGAMASTKFAENKVVQMDAATLYSKWYLGGPDGRIPCTGIRGGPSDLTVIDASDDRSPMSPAPSGGSICNLPGWSVERCKKAREKLETWDVDFRWTETQHAIGAKFGATQCKPETADSKSASSCEDPSAVDASNALRANSNSTAQ